MYKKLLSILLVTGLLGGTLAGCASGSTAEDTTTSVETEQESSSSESSTDTQGYALPLCDPGSETLSILTYQNWHASAYFDSEEGLPVENEIEKITGVNMEWECVPSDDYAAVAQTRLAAGTDNAAHIVIAVVLDLLYRAVDPRIVESPERVGQVLQHLLHLMLAPAVLPLIVIHRKAAVGQNFFERVRFVYLIHGTTSPSARHCFRSSTALSSLGSLVPSSPRKARARIDFLMRSIRSNTAAAASLAFCSLARRSSRMRTISCCSEIQGSSTGKLLSCFELMDARFVVCFEQLRKYCLP